MKKIFVIMGKSATGKDTLYKEILKKKELGLRPVIPYTTRPIREGEQEGVEYHFVDSATYEALKAEGKVIESRDYHTVHGIWSYFTVEDSQFQGEENLLLINTLEGYQQMVKYFGKEKVVPLYIELEDGMRLARALKREQSQKEPKYQELCRRFLADSEDFSEDKLQILGIEKRYENRNMRHCLKALLATISACIGQNSSDLSV